MTPDGWDEAGLSSLADQLGWPENRRLFDLGASLPPDVVQQLRDAHPDDWISTCAARSEGAWCCFDYLLFGADFHGVPPAGTEVAS